MRTDNDVAAQTARTIAEIEALEAAINGGQLTLRAGLVSAYMSGAHAAARIVRDRLANEVDNEAL